MGATFWKGIYTKLLTSGGIEFQDGRIKTQGSGSPEGVVTASVGSEYTDTSTGVLYLKQSGSGNTGWGANVNPALKDIIDYSKPIGEVFFVPFEQDTNFVFDPLNPRDYWPAINLAAINGYEDVTGKIQGGDYPNAFIFKLQNIRLKYLAGLSGEVSSWSCTISGSNITFPNTASANAILAALAEDATINGGYTNFRRITIPNQSSTFAISGINLITRVLSVTGTPNPGTEDVEFQPYITSAGGDARIYGIKGESLMAPNDPDGYFIMNLRTRGYFQGHWHTLNYSTGPADGAVGAQYYSRSSGGSITAVANSTSNLTSSQVVSSPITDGTNGTPLTRKITHGPAYTLIPYMWCGG